MFARARARRTFALPRPHAEERAAELVVAELGGGLEDDAVDVVGEGPGLEGIPDHLGNTRGRAAPRSPPAGASG